MPSRAPILAGLGLAVAAAGCTSYVTPHHVYAPLLDHAGQVDLNVRGGPSTPGGAGVSANVAYAPIDHLEVVGGGDLVFGSRTRHYGGHLGIGTFVREDVLRLEAIAGSYGGYAEGEGTWFVPSSAASYVYALSGSYLMPYGQVLVGFEHEHVELAGGLRLGWFLADVRLDATDGAPVRANPRDGYERFYVEPVITVRFPFDFFRIDLASSVPIAVAGDRSPADLAPEADVMWWLAAGIGFQLDSVERPARPPEPEPVYVPPQAPAQPVQVIVVPGPAPATVPAAPPAYGQPVPVPSAPAPPP